MIDQALRQRGKQLRGYHEQYYGQDGVQPHKYGINLQVSRLA